MPDLTLTIGTRASLLARWQADHVQAHLEVAHPGLTVRQELISTQGDRVLDKPLSQIGGKGLFTKELERALLDGAIDLAVHSLKDLPTEMPDGLMLAAILPRADWQDAFIGPADLMAMPEGARIGTGSLRRAVQLRRLRPDIQILDLRGNVDTRLRKLDAGLYDAIILASAGLHRLGRADRIQTYLPFLPAAGQGAIAIQVRDGDDATAHLLQPLHDPVTATAVTAERAWLAAMDGGCQVPMGALAQMVDGRLVLRAFAADPDGDGYLEASETGLPADASAIGASLAQRLRDAGASAWIRPQAGRDPSVA
ncbi:MAG: hydroxymethylbilane synthase, partial [Candidatus Sericytochromatia bacterium]|nr:hydroxymethylbilane synthase [Candidatus Sericytochromatia bacterium]